MFFKKKLKIKKFSLALVTGASSGIGTALCHLLASKNIPLMITGRDATRLNALAAELTPFVDVITFAADLSTEEGQKTLIKYIHEFHPDLVINNAGFGLYGEVLTYETHEQLKIIQVDATSVLESTLESARTMISNRQKGIILNVSSAAAKQIFPCSAVYAASKSFVNQMSIAFDFEMQPHGVRVLVACPGMVSTAFSSRASGENVISNQKKVMTATFAAEQIWWQIQKQKRLHIFDWKTRLATYVSYFLPTAWTARYLANIIESRHPQRSIIKPK